MSGAAPSVSLLVERWRQTRDPRLVPLIVALGEKQSDDQTAPVAHLKPTALGRALLDQVRAANAERLHSLLPLVDRFVRTARGSWPVVELLAEVPADPRLALLGVALLEGFAELPHTSSKLWRRLVDVVEHHGDSSVALALRVLSLPDTLDPAMRARVSNVTRALAARRGEAALSNDEFERWRAEVAQAPVDAAPAPVADPPTSRDGDALLATVWREPQNDEARLVYADWLGSRSDPRGEFIMLQYQRANGALTTAGAKRERALLKQHFRAWFGALAPVLLTNDRRPSGTAPADSLSVPLPQYDRCVFSKGFLTEVSSFDVPRHRASLLDAPKWATVRRIRFATDVSAAMKCLTHVDGCWASLLGRLSVVPLPLEQLGVVVARDTDTSFDWPAHSVRARRVHVTLSWHERVVWPWVEALLRADPILGSLRFDRSALVDLVEGWRWPLLDGAPAGFSEFDCEVADQERFALRRVDGAWNEATLTLARVPVKDGGDWRELLSVFDKAHRLRQVTVVLDAKANRRRLEGFVNWLQGAAGAPASVKPF